MSKKLAPNKARILERLVEQANIKLKLESYLFDKQLAFVRDPSKRKTAVTTRRSGKSTACAVDLVWTALQKPRSVSLYITLSRNNAKKIIWPMIKQVVSDYGIKAKLNVSDLSVCLENESYIYLSGANDSSEIEKFRGLALVKCYLDEAQSFPSYIEALIDEVLSPALLDNDGTLILIGTPGPVPVGFFYNCAHNKNWSHHFWSLFDNPHIKLKSGKDPQRLLAEELARRGVSADDPKVQREFYGKWILDMDSLVYHYNPNTNHFDLLPSVSHQWNYVFGVDLGFDDADAIAVLAYNDKHPHAYLVEEVVKRKQGVTELAITIQGLIKKYNPEQIVVDTGGLGKKIAEELSNRYQIPLQSADKARKYENIELLNDAMRTRKFYAKSDSRFANDSGLVEWDIDKKTPDRLKISDRYHSDICDAVLYAFRTLYHWLYKPEEIKPKPGQAEYFQHVEQELERAAELRLQLEKEMEAYASGEDIWGKGL